MTKSFDDTALDHKIDNYIETVNKTFPSKATMAGFHEYDHALDHVDSNSLNEYFRFVRKILDDLDSIEKQDRMSQDNRLDIEMFRRHLMAELAEYKMYNQFMINPIIYPRAALFTCFILIIRRFAPAEERYKSLAGRLNDIPRFLSEAENTLSESDSVPKIWIDITRDICRSGKAFFNQSVCQLAGQQDLLKNELLAASTLASKAFDNYVQFLDNELARKPDRSFAAGEEYFNFLLKEYHVLPYDATQLKKIGLEYIESTISQMEEIAADIDSSKDWTEIINDIKSDTPKPEEILEYYREMMQKSREFVIDKNFVSVPEDESLEVIETPVFSRSMLPYAAYMRPAPFEKEQKGFFWVTPVDTGLPEEKVKEQLSGHSRAAIVKKAIHEGYPGHHLQLCHANRLKSKIRRLMGTTSFIEGWAFYCEEMMKEQGFYDDKRIVLIQLKDQLWRACRVVIDVGLHTGDMTFGEAVEMLVKTARLEKGSAVAEVKRYTHTPAQPMSYLTGKIELTKLIEEYREKYPAASLKEIHDFVLSCGSFPIALIRKGIPGTN